MLDILRRAWGDAKRSFGLRWQSFVHYVIVPGLAVFLLWLLLGRKQAMDEIWIFGCYLAAVFLLFVFSFLWNLWLAPYRMLKEEVDKLPKSSGITIHGSLAQGFNVKIWEGIPVFQLGDAACLWVGIQPHDPIESEKALAMFKRLSGAVVSGQLKCSAGFGGLNNLLFGRPWWPEHAQRVSAINLKRHADNIGKVPPFLQAVEVPPEDKPSEEKDAE